ncbi:MAG: carboxypeptidase regulatory-like domain-containing protein [Planctomycetota bacterium]
MTFPATASLLAKALFALGTLAAAPVLCQQADSCTIRGQVVDMFGTAIVGADIVHDDWSIAEPKRPRTLSDEDGYFTLTNLPRRNAWRLQSRYPGMGNVTTMHRNEHRILQVTMFDALVTHGTLRDQLGQPVADTQVRGLTFLKGVHEQIVKTDANGAFVFDRLPPGPTSLVAHVVGEGLYMQNRYVQQSGLAQLRSNAANTANVTLQFFGLNTNQRADALVRMVPNRGYTGLPPSWDRVALDDYGNCRLTELPAVTYDVRLISRSGAFLPVVRPLDARSSDPVVRFDIRPEELKEPAPGQTAFDSLAQAIPELPKLGPDWIFATPEASGDGTIGSEANSSLAAGTAAALLQGFGGSPTIRGRVTDANSNPAVGIVVELRPVAWDTLLGDTIAGAVTDADGTYTFDDLPPYSQPVVVVAGPVGGWAQGAPIDLDGMARDITADDMQLSDPGRVFGVVRDRNGRPAAGIRIRLLSIPDGHGGSTIDEVVSNQSGEFCFLNVAPGNGRLQAFAEEGPGNADEGRLFPIPSGRTVMRTLDQSK